MPYDNIRRLLKDGYPYKIKGNGGFECVLIAEQPLLDGEYCAIYRYPRGECCHSLHEIKKHFKTIRRFPDGFVLNPKE